MAKPYLAQAIDDVMFPFKRSFNAAGWQTRTSERRPDPRVLLLGADSQMGCPETRVGVQLQEERGQGGFLERVWGGRSVRWAEGDRG